MPSCPSAVDELDVEHPLRAVDDARAVPRQLRHFGTAGAVPLQALRVLEEPVGREDLQARVLGRDQDDEHLRARRRPLLLRERHSGLVAVVAVRDQQLLFVERPHERRVVEPPQLRALDLELGLAFRPPDRGRPVVEQEDRLELDARRPEQAEPALLRRCVRPLVREYGAGLVGLDLQRGDDPEARPRDPVRSDVVLLERPDRRRLLDEDAFRAPGLEVACGLLLRVGQRQADDVVRAAGAQLLALLLGDDVVRRRHEPLERPGCRLVVAQRAKGLDHGHGGQRTNRLAP